ncbi:MAG: YbhB/YbcL family Raf kinase inhibitor-like protein [Pseudomonadota bacterium]
MRQKTIRFTTVICMIFMVFIISSAGAAPDNTPPVTPVKLIFIHHSTGGNWLADANTGQPHGELGSQLMANHYFVSATNYGWGPGGIGDSTDIPYWPEWFTGSNSATILSALFDETGQNFGDFGSWSRLSTDPGGENKIIMFKSCFPNSDLYGTPTDAAAAAPNEEYTVSNAKAVYNNLLTYFRTRPDKLFIVVTAPPQRESDYSADSVTPSTRAANARAFNNWLLNDWLADYPYYNVAVFDYFNVLTGTDNHHRWNTNAVEHVTTGASNFAAYPSDDSHPSTEGQQKATGEFVDLLNYYYNRWVANQGTVVPSCEKVNISRIQVSPTTSPQLNAPLTVTVTASCAGGNPIYYKFYYRANYGTSAYDTSEWVVVQDYSTSNSAPYSFAEAGNYIIVVRAVTDPANEPQALPIIGQVVTVSDSSQIVITALSSNSTSLPTVGQTVTYTATASAPSGSDVYYRFYYCAAYGTNAYDTTPWTLVQDYSTSHSCAYTFPAAGDYIVVARAVTTPDSEPAALPIIGGVVSVQAPFQVTSTAFSDGAAIPPQYSCNGADISPPLAFSGIPAQTQSLVVICDDPDAPEATFVHWVLFNLPATTTSLAENVPALPTLSSGAKHGVNDFGNSAYGGPCPPSGTHRYYFKVYALDTTLTLDAGATVSAVVDAMEGHILSQAELMGTYGN